MFATRRARARPFALSLVLSTILVGPATAQQAPQRPAALTVDDAVREAIDRNLMLIAERYSVSVAQARIVTAGLRPNPVLTVSTMLPSADVFDNSVSPREQVVHTDVLFERGGKRDRRVEVAEAAKSVTELQLLNTMRTIVLDVQSACVDVVQAKQNLALARESLDAFNALGACAPENGTIFQLSTLPQERRPAVDEGSQYPGNRVESVLPRRLLDSCVITCP